MNKYFVKSNLLKKSKTVLLASKETKDVRELKALLSNISDISEIKSFLNVETLLAFCNTNSPRQYKNLSKTIIVKKVDCIY
jgi:hypothetical protein